MCFRERKKHKVREEMQMNALLSAVYYPSDITILHISGCVLQRKKTHYVVIQVNSFIILLNISLLLRFLFYLPRGNKTKQRCAFLHI